MAIVGITSSTNLPLTTPITGLVGKTPLANPVSETSVIGSVTTVTYTEQLWRDLATLSTITEVFTTEDTYLHPTGSWGPFDTDNGAI